jgi:hypothetical protein
LAHGSSPRGELPNAHCRDSLVKLFGHHLRFAPTQAHVVAQNMRDRSAFVAAVRALAAAELHLKEGWFAQAIRRHFEVARLEFVPWHGVAPLNPMR